MLLVDLPTSPKVVPNTRKYQTKLNPIVLSLTCFHADFGREFSFLNIVERSILKLPLSELCAITLALQNRALFEGERRAKRCGEKGRGLPAKGAKGKKGKKGRVKTGLVAQLLDPPYRTIGYRYPYRTYIFSGIARHRAIPPQTCPIAAEGGGWQGVSQVKLPSRGYRAIRRYR